MQHCNQLPNLTPILSTDRIPNLEHTQVNIRYLISNHLLNTACKYPSLWKTSSFAHDSVAHRDRSNISPRRLTNPESSNIVTTPRSVPASKLHSSIN